MNKKIKLITSLIVALMFLIIPREANAAECEENYHYLFSQPFSALGVVNDSSTATFYYPGSSSIIDMTSVAEGINDSLNSTELTNYIDYTFEVSKHLANYASSHSGNLPSSAKDFCVLGDDNEYYCQHIVDRPNQWDELYQVIYYSYYYNMDSSKISELKSKLRSAITNDYLTEVTRVGNIDDNPSFNVSTNELNIQLSKTYNLSDHNKLNEIAFNLYDYKEEINSLAGEDIFPELDSDVGNSCVTYVVDGGANAGKTANTCYGVIAIDYVVKYTNENCGTYTIRYDANGGENAPASQTKNEGETIRLSTQKPTRDGYTFLGWSTNKNATSKDSTYDPGSSYSKDANLTLYAVWQNNSAVDGKPSDNDQNSPQTGVGIGLGIIALSLIGGTAGIIYVNKSNKFRNI